jgi:hypothetical protein
VARKAKKRRIVDLDRTRVEIPESVLTREIDGELVLLDLRSEAYFGLDDVGTRFWAALAENPTLPEARRALLEAFEVEPARLERDLARLLGELEAHGLVALRDD